MDKKILKQINSIRKEITYFEDKIKKIDEKPVKIVKDSVSGSSKEFPYTSHSVKIEGFETPKNKRKYKKLLKDAKYKLEKAINSLEYELKSLNDSDLRMIIRLKYIDNMNNIQVAHKLNSLDENKNNKVFTADSVRMQLKRFLKE